MRETREFSTAALASITSGILLCKFGDMHEAAEFVMGHPIWTHHFASKQLNDDMRKTLLAQHPGLPIDIEGVTAENYLEHVAALEAKLGKTLSVTKGSGSTATLPTDGIPDHLKDKTIIVSVDPAEGDTDLCDDCGSALRSGEGGDHGEPNRCDACNVTRREIDRPVTDPTDGGGNVR
jgi:hypothetical protein